MYVVKRIMSSQRRPIVQLKDPVVQHEPSDSSTTHSPRSIGNPLSSKINSVLSTSFADGEFQEVLSTVDNSGLTNTPVTRRQLRLQLQQEVIASNGEVVEEFGRVAEVRLLCVSSCAV